MRFYITFFGLRHYCWRVLKVYFVCVTWSHFTLILSVHHLIPFIFNHHILSNNLSAVGSIESMIFAKLQRHFSPFGIYCSVPCDPSQWVPSSCALHISLSPRSISVRSPARPFSPFRYTSFASLVSLGVCTNQLPGWGTLSAWLQADPNIAVSDT